MLKILPYSYEEDIKHFSSGNTNQDIFWWFTKVLWHGQGCIGHRCKGSQNNKEIIKKIKQMDSFSFLTETPFSKLK